MKFLLFLLLSVTVFGARSQSPVRFTIKLNDTAQQVRNIGASACWYAEEIGATWPEKAKQAVAEKLFSRGFAANGQPKGIGLSAFRFNIGAGTAEQGDSSGIADPSHRVECFLNTDGTYNWQKQKGYQWLLQQAKKYGVEDRIAFVNSPPVHFTKNGLGFKLAKDHIANLKPDNYTAYASFLANVLAHFQTINLPFQYISPVNEPQWDWSGTMGTAKQEGSPWTNAEIYRVAVALDSSLTAQHLQTKMLLPEAAMLTNLYAPGSKAGQQVAAFWNGESVHNMGGLPHATPFVQGHGYFTDAGDAEMIKVRRSLRDTLKAYDTKLEYWQSEYCMLGDGYKDGATGGRSAMGCALFLAKIIHHDFTIGNATAWHYWNAFEPGRADSNTRYYLVALNPNRKKDTAKRYTVTKNLWALGHFSLFVRPGMYRVLVDRSDALNDTAAAQQVMVSAFRDAGGNAVVNVINYTPAPQPIMINFAGAQTPKLHKQYVTSAKPGDDLKAYPISNLKPKRPVVLPPRSITTFLFKP